MTEDKNRQMLEGILENFIKEVIGEKDLDLIKLANKAISAISALIDKAVEEAKYTALTPTNCTGLIDKIRADERAKRNKEAYEKAKIPKSKMVLCKDCKFYSRNFFTCYSRCRMNSKMDYETGKQYLSGCYKNDDGKCSDFQDKNQVKKK